MFKKVFEFTRPRSEAVVVAQLAEWSLPRPEVRSSNPVVGEFLYRTFIFTCIEKTKIEKKRRGKVIGSR